jgi:hypothetical protein
VQEPTPPDRSDTGSLVGVWQKMQIAADHRLIDDDFFQPSQCCQVEVAESGPVRGQLAGGRDGRCCACVSRLVSFSLGVEY